MDEWSSQGEGRLEGHREGSEAAMDWGRRPQVSMENEKRKPLMETGSLGVAPAGRRRAIPMTGLAMPLLQNEVEQGLSCLKHLLQGHVNLCYNAWRWLLQSHFIYGGFIGRGVGVQYNFSHSDVSISLTSHLHF